MLTGGVALFACGTSHNSGWSNGSSGPGGSGGTSGSGGSGGGGGPLGTGTPGGGNGLALGGYDASAPGSSSGGGGTGGTTGGANQPLTPAMGSATAPDCSGCSFPPANAAPCASSAP